MLKKLFDEGGDEGVHAVNYILENDVQFSFSQESQPAAWHLLSNDIYLDSDHYSENFDPTDPYLLSLIAHEALHLEQGPFFAFTLAGEVEAWQAGFAVYKTLTGQYPGNPVAASNIMTLDARNMSRTDRQNTRQWMKDFDPGYRSQWLYPWSTEFIRETYDLPDPSDVCWDFCFP